MELDSRSVWRLAHPDVEILAFAGLEEENIVAVVQVGKFVQLVEFCLGVELCVLAAVGKKRVEVVEKMTVSVKVRY